MPKRVALFGCDLAVIGLAPLLAFVLRERFDASYDELKAFLPYVGTSLLIGGALLLVFRTHRGLWRLSTLRDHLRLCLVALLVVTLSMSVGFVGNRLQNIPRALPVLQLLLTLGGLVGLRVAARLLVDWSRTWRAKAEGAVARAPSAMGARTVIVYGLNRLTMLYTQFAEELAPAQVRIAGIVTGTGGTKGRAIGGYPVLGRPRDLSRIVADLSVHGVYVSYVCVMKSREDLGPDDLENLSKAARESGLVIEYFVDKLTGVNTEGVSVRPSLVPRAFAPHGGASDLSWSYAQAETCH